jgi:hypothetical protein
VIVWQKLMFNAGVMTISAFKSATVIVAARDVAFKEEYFVHSLPEVEVSSQLAHTYSYQQDLYFLGTRISSSLLFIFIIIIVVLLLLLLLLLLLHANINYAKIAQVLAVEMCWQCRLI